MVGLVLRHPISKAGACAWFGLRIRPPPVAEEGRIRRGSGRKNRGQRKPDDFFGHRNPAAKPRMPQADHFDTKSI